MPARTTPPRPARSRSPVKARKAAGGGAAQLRRLRPLCLGLPGAVEHRSHGEPTWRVREGGPTFAMFDNHHHGAPEISVWLASPPEVQEALVAAAPARYRVPPYVGVRGWVAVVLDAGTDWRALAGLLRAAFERQAAPRRARRGR